MNFDTATTKMFFHLTTILLLAVHVSALADPQIANFLIREKVRLGKPVSLAERHAAKIETRHWRPALAPRGEKKPEEDAISGPDIGQVGRPVPHRDGIGSDFTDVDTNPEFDAQNPDYVAPVLTDAGNLPNMKWSFSLSANHLYDVSFLR